VYPMLHFRRKFSSGVTAHGSTDESAAPPVACTYVNVDHHAYHMICWVPDLATHFATAERWDSCLCTECLVASLYL